LCCRHGIDPDRDADACAEAVTDGRDARDAPSAANRLMIAGAGLAFTE
jgi:hypothetical protein